MDDPELWKGYDKAERIIWFGADVRRARERAGISQAELASRVGTSRPAIARLEMGGVDPKLGTLRCIAEALGATLICEFRLPEATTAR